MEALIGSYVIRFRWPIMVVTLLSILVCVYGATQLRFTNDYRIFFGDKNPQLQAFDKFQAMYGKQDSILIAVASKTGDIFFAENIAISAVILVALRNVKLGLLSLIPNTLPILMTYGVWAIVVGELGMSGAFVSVIVLGVIVDDTVHFLSKYLRQSVNSI